MNKKINLAIVIATHNRSDLLLRLLHQLYNQTFNNFRVILIDDGSTDGTSDKVLKEYPEVLIIKGNGNWWWTKCMNEGFKKALELGMDYILILNDDVEIKKDYLQLLLNEYKSLPEGSILGSASVSMSKPTRIESAGTYKFIRWRLKFVSYFKGHPQINESFKGVHRTLTLSGRGTLIPTSVFKKIGLYDPKLIQYGSDEEFCIRAVKNKIGVYISWNARVYNNTNYTSKGSPFSNDSILIYLKSFFSKYSVNSLQKSIYLYWNYGYKVLTPFFIIYYFLGSFKAYLFNYRHKFNNTLNLP